MSDIADKVRVIIAEQLAVKADKVTDDACLIEDLGGDSLDVVELVMTLEEIFEIDVPDDDITTLKCVSDVIDYVTKVKNADN